MLCLGDNILQWNAIYFVSLSSFSLYFVYEKLIKIKETSDTSFLPSDEVGIYDLASL